MNILDGKVIWSLHATHGFPLEISIPMIADKGFVPSWDRLLNAAKKDGTNIDRLVGRLQDIARDAYAEPTSNIIAERLPKLNNWLKRKEK
jgi:alanyl-tRNA synthetase